MASGGTILGRP